MSVEQVPSDQEEIEMPPLPSVDVSTDQDLRAFIVEHYGEGAFEIDGRIFVENMEYVFQWIRHGTVPVKDKKKG